MKIEVLRADIEPDEWAPRDSADVSQDEVVSVRGDDLIVYVETTSGRPRVHITSTCDVEVLAIRVPQLPSR